MPWISFSKGCFKHRPLILLASLLFSHDRLHRYVIKNPSYHLKIKTATSANISCHVRLHYSLEQYFLSPIFYWFKRYRNILGKNSENTTGTDEIANQLISQIESNLSNMEETEHYLLWPLAVWMDSIESARQSYQLQSNQL